MAKKSTTAIEPRSASSGIPCPESIKELVENFNRDIDRYKSDDYKEHQVRSEFIDPMLEALGWNVRNTGLPYDQREVIGEDRLKAEDAPTAPDYGVYLGKKRRFFIEAKKPRVNLDRDTSAAYQLRRYGWSAKLPLCILTDFEELGIYDTRIEPQRRDSTRKARWRYYRLEEYQQKWGEIAELFSKDAVAGGSLDRFAESKQTKGSRSVDDAFLATIRVWRETLAKDLHRNNSLSEADLNRSVQAIIDRLLFLRICEDRGTEEHGRLKEAAKQKDPYAAFMDLCRAADRRYNSGLFHFDKERGRGSEPDFLTPGLRITPLILRKIIVDDLYYPSPYLFSVFPPDALGHVYEQFLGDVITVSKSGKTVSITRKPEVRKAGGVFYTPTYIVDYIVEQTVGELVKGKQPHEVAGRTAKQFKPAANGHPMRVLDPACGSGSFLIGAYQFLLDWYQQRYREDSKTWRKHGCVFDASKNDFRLTIRERKRILLDHIYGVDIDRQAVEVSKLSLLLKCLEGENQGTLESLFQMKERALPDLGDNIKCGNSIVGPDAFVDTLIGAHADDDMDAINPFNWQSEFAAVFDASGGFDAVVGNPPYIDSEWMVRHRPIEREYCADRYKAASGNWDVFCVFIERGILSLRGDGRFAYIVPNKVGSAGLATGARSVAACDNTLIKIRDYSAVPVFPVAVYPIVISVQRRKPTSADSVCYERVTISDGSRTVTEPRSLPYDNRFLNPADTWPGFGHADADALVSLLRERGKPLESYAAVTGAATVGEAYEIAEIVREGSPETGSYALVNSGLIDPYMNMWGSKPCRYLGSKYTHPVVDQSELQKLSRTRDDQARTAKIIISGMTKRLECVGDHDGAVLAGKSTTIVLPNREVPLRYILGILNSSLMSVYYSAVFGGNRLAGGYLRIGPPQIRTLPIAWPVSKAQVQALSDAVQGVEAATKSAGVASSRKRSALTQHIDSLVAGIYELPPDAIKIIAEASRTA